MATLERKTQSRQQLQYQLNRQQQQHHPQQKQKQQQCHNVADSMRTSITKTSQRQQQQKQTLGKTSLIQRKKLTIELDKSGRTIAAKEAECKAQFPSDVSCHSQGHKRVSHKNKYTTARSANRTIQQNQQHTKYIKNINFGLSEKTISLTSIKTSTFQYLNWNCSNLVCRLNSTFCIMLTMLVVATIVISGNAALAAQRDSFKVKEIKSLSNSVNAIPAGSYAANSGSANSNDDNGNGNTANANSGNVNGNVNIINNGNAISNNVGADIINVASQSAIDAATILSTSTATINNNSNNMNQTTVTTSQTSAAATTTIMSTSTGTATKISTSPSNTIASGSLQKANSANINSPNGNIGINRNAIEIMEDTRSGPYFDKAASKNITALLGKTAYLNCRVKNLGNKTMLLQVSWVRHRDIHLLTVGRYTYTSDQRFRAIHQPQTEDWILQIKYPQHRDSGIYECQVSTTPHMSHYIHLNVVEPSTEIIGAPDLYIESGSTINLTCVILNSPEPPAYIFWNHNNAIINYDSPRGGVSVVTNKGETTTSFLLIKSARPSDSGLYQCNPSNAKPKSVTVHVLNGVSHSVSRGVPSSNAARGTSASSNVSKSLCISVPVNVLIYLGVYRTLYEAIATVSTVATTNLKNRWYFTTANRKRRESQQGFYPLLLMLITLIWSAWKKRQRKKCISGGGVGVGGSGSGFLHSSETCYACYGCVQVKTQKMVSENYINCTNLETVNVDEQNNIQCSYRVCRPIKYNRASIIYYLTGGININDTACLRILPPMNSEPDIR